MIDEDDNDGCVVIKRLLSQCAWAGLYLNVKNHLTIPSCTTQYPVEILPQPPLYEDYVPGLKSTGQWCFDDLLSGFGKGSGRNGSEKDDKAGSDFDDLLAGFGRHAPNIGLSSEPTISASKTTSTAAEDPLKVYESTSAPMDSSTSNFTDPFEEISKFNGSRSTKNNSSSTSNGIIYEDTDSFDGLGRSVPALSSQRNSSKGFRF
ncbi:hypothetical protein MTR_8g094000 [Medicago truncatula]|uniref:Uncharacterized protein n=1 Tax=Medicago truncatula TaxID=3880 RepID=G7LE53_MEDTR|nr:hypothetical protein MTR_8g094000 [Medicago truncatula]